MLAQCDQLTKDPYKQTENTTVKTQYVVQVGSFVNPPRKLHIGLMYYMERCSNKYIVEDSKSYPSKALAAIARDQWIRKGYKGSFIKEIYIFIAGG